MGVVVAVVIIVAAAVVIAVNVSVVVAVVVVKVAPNKSLKFFPFCFSPDATGANFCYVSGRAERECRDVQESATRKDSFSNYVIIFL